MDELASSYDKQPPTRSSCSVLCVIWSVRSPTYGQDHSQQPHNYASTVRCKEIDLKHVEELKGLHLEAKAGVNQQQHQVGELGRIDHCIEILRAQGTVDSLRLRIVVAETNIMSLCRPCMRTAGKP